MSFVVENAMFPEFDQLPEKIGLRRNKNILKHRRTRPEGGSNGADRLPATQENGRTACSKQS
jgi:hypothetical protein